MEKGNLNSLDDFITTIVMNFELTAPVKRVLSRLSEIRKKGNEYLVSFSDNGLSWKTRNGRFSETIVVDAYSKKIRIEESGVKDVSEDQEFKDYVKATKNYFTKQIYSVFDDKSTNYSYNREYVIARDKNNTRILASISKGYNFFNGERFLGRSLNIDTKDVLKDDDNNTIDESSSSISDNIYVLATGDRLEKKTINGDTECYFFSKNSASGDSFKKIINLDEFDELMSLDDDPYVVANNDIVYDVRKTNYS